VPKLLEKKQPGEKKKNIEYIKTGKIKDLRNLKEENGR